MSEDRLPAFLPPSFSQTQFLTQYNPQPQVKGGETGDVSWYYSAPEKFLGDQQKLYHGILKYTLVYIRLAIALHVCCVLMQGMLLLC